MSDPTQLSLTALAQAIAKCKISSVEAVQACLDRIAEWQPKLNCFIRVEPEAAFKSAKAVDQALAKRRKLGPLAGVPLAHKDMYYRFGKVATCGSAIRRDWVADTTATALERLGAAGAVNLGTLNMAEFAFGPSGHNWHFGHCRNPWDPSRVTGGSSSGSGSAVAARLAFGALGSDTGGSIRMPAHFCGLAGIKPTTTRVSRAGAMPLSFTLDTVGTLTRTVEDSALMLRIVAGADSADPTASTRRVPDYLAECRKPAKGLRLAIPRKFFFDDLDPAVAKVMDAALAEFKRLGVKLVEVETPDMERVNAAAMLVINAEAATYHRNWMAKTPQLYSDQVRARLQTGMAVTAVQYLDAMRWRGQALREFLALFAKADAVLAPVYVKPTPTIAETDVGGSPNATAIIAAFTRLCRPINYLGLPALSVPGGFAHDMPIGFQLIGRPFDESTLFRLGAAYQRATDWHTRAPKAN
ncbi:MAG: amidase [Alphaproteobacteria bacterium]|nr:amidase [Alphaproteobacteria bacterium]